MVPQICKVSRSSIWWRVYQMPFLEHFTIVLCRESAARETARFLSYDSLGRFVCQLQDFPSPVILLWLVKDTISSHKLCRYILSVRPYLTALATQDCCRAFGSSTMVDPFLLRAREAFPCNLFSLILLWSVTLTGTRLPPLQFAAKRPKFFVLCRCCTLCTASRENFTSHRFQLCWLLPTLHLSYWQMICASLDKSRDLQLPFSHHSLPLPRKIAIAFFLDPPPWWILSFSEQDGVFVTPSSSLLCSCRVYPVGCKAICSSNDRQTVNSFRLLQLSRSCTTSAGPSSFHRFHLCPLQPIYQHDFRAFSDIREVRLQFSHNSRASDEETDLPLSVPMTLESDIHFCIYWSFNAFENFSSRCSYCIATSCRKFLLLCHLQQLKNQRQGGSTLMDASEDACSTVQYAQSPQHSFILCLIARNMIFYIWAQHRWQPTPLLFHWSFSVSPRLLWYSCSCCSPGVISFQMSNPSYWRCKSLKSSHLLLQ